MSNTDLLQRPNSRCGISIVQVAHPHLLWKKEKQKDPDDKVKSKRRFRSLKLNSCVNKNIPTSKRSRFLDRKSQNGDVTYKDTSLMRHT